MSQFQHLLEGIVDEDEAYETGEALLGEAGEVLDQEAGIGGHQDQAEERRPQADPQAELQIIEVVVPARSSKTGAPNQWESFFALRCCSNQKCGFHEHEGSVENTENGNTGGMRNALAEVEQQPFEDQDGTGAAEDGERLASQQTEDPTSDRRAQKTLQHALRTRAQTLVRPITTWTGNRAESRAQA